MRYEVKAFRVQEAPVSLTLEAADAAAAGLQAERQGYAVLKIKPRQSLLDWLPARKSVFPLALFSQELLSLLDAGLSLIEAMAALTEKEAHAETRRVLTQTIAYLNEGQALSYALQQLPSVFPPLYVAMLRAAERTGDLGGALRRYVTYQAQVDLVRKKIVSASIYPVLLLSVGGLVVFFLMAYVVPKFSAIYESTGANLPWVSQLLLKWGQLLHEHGAGVLAVFIIAALALAYGLSRPAVRRWVVARLWRVPAVGERMRVYQLARLYRALAMLLNGGIPVSTALDMVQGLLQPVLRARLQAAGRLIREGQSISQAMDDNGLATPVALRLLRVGERSGQMGEMMERIANFYDEEMARWVEWFTRLFEPLLMTLIGLVIGIIVVLMYLPIFELAGSIQ